MRVAVPWIVLTASAIVSPMAQAKDIVVVHDSVQVNSTDNVTDIVCAFCTVRLDGPIKGDLVTAFADVEVAPGVSVDGDFVSAFTHLRMANGSSIGQDMVYFGGEQQIAPSANIEKDRVGVPQVIAVLLLLIPLCFIAGMIYLIIFIIRRLVRGPEPRFPYPPPGYPR